MKTLKDYEYFRTENGVLYCGDNMEILPLITDEIDLCLTDPPYNASNSKIKLKNYTTINEKWDKNYEPIKIIESIKTKIKENGSMLFFCSYHLLGEYLCYKKEKVQQIIHWEHITALPAIAKVYTPVIEYCVWYSRKNYIFNKKEAKKNLIRSLKDDIEHPSPKPLNLIQTLLKIHSNENNLILDPFLGSGTTALACEKLNRKWIGIEISEKYCEIAKKRVEEYTSQLKLFK